MPAGGGPASGRQVSGFGEEGRHPNPNLDRNPNRPRNVVVIVVENRWGEAASRGDGGGEEVGGGARLRLGLGLRLGVRGPASALRVTAGRQVSGVSFKLRIADFK